jgi:hypothetical protein
MSDDRPPPPGPRPAGFDYPFARMADARGAALALAADLDRLVQDHERQAGDAVVGFEGAARAEFEVLFGAAMEGVEDLARRLRGQAGGLADDHSTARARERAADDTLTAWQAANDAWLAHR